MSLTAFKKKSVIQYGSKRSGKPPGGYWLPQGPFGPDSVRLKDGINIYGPVGFSLNGPHRNVGYVGKDSKMSRNGTPYRGVHAIGWGGSGGRYPVTEPVLNVNRVIALGDQWQYVKQSTVSNKTMLEQKYRWAYTGKYPNNWVQPIYTGNQTDSKSQGLYVHDKTTSNICKVGVNDTEIYLGFIKHGGPTLCSTSTARFKYNDMARNGLYTKNLYQPQDSSQHTLRIQKRCTDPVGPQKPFPYAVQTGTGIHVGGTSVLSVGNACNTSNTVLAPPDWYISGATTAQLRDHLATEHLSQSIAVINSQYDLVHGQNINIQVS